MQIAGKSIELASVLGVRTVMIPGYDIYYGESTVETKDFFWKMLKKLQKLQKRKEFWLDLKRWKIIL